MSNNKGSLAEIEARRGESADRLIKRWERHVKKIGLMEEVRNAFNREPKKSLRLKAKKLKAERRRRVEARKYGR